MNVRDRMRYYLRWLRTPAGWKGSEFEQWQAHLARLELFGTEFRVSRYLAALAAKDKQVIRVFDYPDEHSTLLRSWELEEGSFGIIARSKKDGVIKLSVRESLKYRPWPAYELALFHEIMHYVCDHQDEELLSEREYVWQEEQAVRWANWTLLAGCEPELFSREATETIT